MPKGFVFMIVAICSSFASAALAIDTDGDGSPDEEELLAGTDINDPGLRPYWWRTFSLLPFRNQETSTTADVNGDGYADIVIARSTGDITLVYVYSGKTANLLYTLRPELGDKSAVSFGKKVSNAGDVNDDGYQDLMVASPSYGSAQYKGLVTIYSGVDGRVLHQLRAQNHECWGSQISGAGDVNNDGYGDLLVQAGCNGVLVYSGRDGSVLYELEGSSEINDSFGVSLSSAGDVNNDGYADVIVGAPFGDETATAGSSTLQRTGSAKVFSGVDGSLLYSFYGPAVGSRFGESVDAAGDVDGDGYDDLIVGAFQDDTNGNNDGSATVFSGLDGSIIYQFYEDAGYLGYKVGGVGDLNDDGYDDVLVTLGKGANRFVNVFSGKDGSVIYQIRLESKWSELSELLSSGDVNNDGYSDFVVSYRVEKSNVPYYKTRVFLSSDLQKDLDQDFAIDAVEASLFLTDPQKADTDDDQVLDGIELSQGADPFIEDSDFDGVVDRYDNCPVTVNPDQKDLDSDRIGDLCDEDIDGDGLSNEDETTIFLTDPENWDSDGDDNLDNDYGLSDGDEVALGLNPLSVDSDGDGLSDRVDNCPAITNADQSDMNNDHIGDVCDADVDGDFVSNDEEINLYFTDPLNRDSDLDGFDDGLEVWVLGTDPAVADLDSDDDGMMDDWELVYSLDPFDPADAFMDADGDGWSNWLEFSNGSNPLQETAGATEPEVVKGGCELVYEYYDWFGNGYGASSLECSGHTFQAGKAYYFTLDGYYTLPPLETVKSVKLFGNYNIDSEIELISLAPNLYGAILNGSYNSPAWQFESSMTDSDDDGFYDFIDLYPSQPTLAGDHDYDGIDSLLDAFPHDKYESLDSDNDGIGDNTDLFPNDPTETIDTDADGVGDNSDAFPNDSMESQDSDGDGVGDNEDQLPFDPADTVDTDGDGVGDNSDIYPNNPQASSLKTYDGAGSLPLTLMALLLSVLVFRKRCLSA